MSFCFYFQPEAAPSSDPQTMYEFNSAHAQVFTFSPTTQSVQDCFVQFNACLSEQTRTAYPEQVRVFTERAFEALTDRVSKVAVPCIDGQQRSTVEKMVPDFLRVVARSPILTESEKKSILCHSSEQILVNPQLLQKAVETARDLSLVSLFWNKKNKIPIALSTLPTLDKKVHAVREYLKIISNHSEVEGGIDGSYCDLLCLPEEIAIPNLRVLNLKGNYIRTVPEAFCSLDKLVFLDLSENRIDSIPLTFGKLQGLYWLDLSHNKLRNVPESFQSLQTLNTLWLDDNCIQSLPRLGLHGLEFLSLSHNFLTSLTVSGSFQASLKHLNVSDNQIAFVDESIGAFRNLERLLLDNNRLLSLSESIGSCTKLTDLNVGNNKLKTLPNSIGSLSSLEHLWADHNQIAALPNTIGQLQALQSVGFSHNLLVELPQSFGNLIAADSIHLDHNRLSRLPDSFCNLKNLWSLELSHNVLQSLPDGFGKLPELVWCCIDHNRLAFLPASIGEIASLRGLDLSYNCLKEVPDTIGAISKLWILMLHHNQIAALPDSLCNLAALEELFVGNNQLSTLPDKFGNLQALHILSLHDNNLRGFPASFSNLSRLWELCFARNPVRKEDVASLLPPLITSGKRKGRTGGLSLASSVSSLEFWADTIKRELRDPARIRSMIHYGAQMLRGRVFQDDEVLRDFIKTSIQSKFSSVPELSDELYEALFDVSWDYAGLGDGLIAEGAPIISSIRNMVDDEFN